MSTAHHDVDLAIFGSGFAAYEIARTAVDRGQSVAVIERGSAEPADADPSLSSVPYRREPVVSGGVEFGAQVPEAFATAPRYVGLGGTSELWSGKWRRLDRIDVERRRGRRCWLVPADELATHYDAIAATYGYPQWPTDAALADDHALLRDHQLRAVEIYEQTPPLRLRPKWQDLARQPSVTVLHHAIVGELVFAAGQGRLASVRVHHHGGESVVAARAFVIACGGIESVHIAHRISTEWPRRSASTPEAYGGFMDHPKGFVGEVTLERHAPLMESFLSARAHQQRLFAFGLPEDELRASGIGNHTAFLWPSGTPAPAHPFRIVINLEQFPEDENRVIAGARPSVSWRVSSQTWKDYEAFMARLIPRLTTLLGPVRRVDAPSLRGASHHAGALPMGEPGESLVDGDCRLHDLANVYCVSSAVFPLAGSTNPTMTVLALARRLARGALVPLSS